MADELGDHGYSIGPTADVEALDLTVVVPCHNAGSTLTQQLDVLIEERWNRRWGIVVVDNRSTDDTAEIASGYGDRGVRLVTANAGTGVSYARNAGAAAVDSRAVAFVDGDDIIHPGWVRAIGNALDTADLVGGSNDVWSLNPPWLAESRPAGRGDGLPTFGKLEFVPGGNCGIRRGLYDRLGGYDEDFVGLEDIEFSLRAVASGATLKFVPGAVLSYRYREDIGDVWHQGFFYGRGRPALILRARELGLPAPPRWEGVRSWAWLLVHLPQLRHRAGRYKWLWVLANRIGVIRGAISARSFFV